MEFDINSYSDALIVWCPDCGAQNKYDMKNMTQLVCQCGCKGQEGWDPLPPVKWTLENKDTGEQIPLARLMKRFDPAWCDKYDNWPGLVEDPDGDYVLYADAYELQRHLNYVVNCTILVLDELKKDPEWRERQEYKIAWAAVSNAPCRQIEEE